jgi:quinol monooxygenase YgiN
MVIIAGYTIVPEKDRDRYVEAFRDLVRRSRAADGVVDVAITADSVHPGRVNMIEIWQSANDLDAWREVANAPELDVPILEEVVKRYNATDGGPLFP